MAAPSRLSAVVGDSQRLRDQALARIRAGWTGPVERQVEPADLSRMLLTLETPSLFGDSAMVILRADERWVGRHRDQLLPHVGAPITAGAMVLVLDSFDGRDALAKALIKHEAFHVVTGPDPRDAAGWVALQLGAHPQGVTDLHRLCTLLVSRLGSDADAILSAIDLVALACLPGKLDPAIADALIAGEAEQPLWAFAGALLDGKANDCLRQLHAPHAPDVNPLLATVAGEIRRLIAAHDSKDDSEAARQSGAKAGAMYHARRRAARWPRANLVRLLTGVHLCLRQTRTGHDPIRAVEMLILHAQRLLPARGG